MIRKFKFVVKGTGARGQTWEARGEIESPIHDVSHTFNIAMADAFRQLTQGKAVYGNPGVGCAGPYEVTSFHMDKAVST
jgi:hypothetical protein